MAVNIYCDYKYFSWSVLGNSYTCQVINLNVTQANEILTKVSGKHCPRLSNIQVKAIDIRREICEFLPQNIMSHFPNLEILQIMNSKLKVITQTDLKPFTKLRVLHLIANQIDSLEQNLFQFNTNLVRIDFKHQSIKFISYNLFDNLKKLSLADFESSGCVNIYALQREGIDNLKKEIRINCQPIEDVISELKILKGKVALLESESENWSKVKQTNYESDPTFEKFDANIRKLQEDNAKCADGLEAVTRNFVLLSNKLEATEKALQQKLEEAKRDACKTQEFAYQKCLIENENLQRLRREASSITIICENTEWSKPGSLACNVKGLTVNEPNIEIRSVESGKLNQTVNAGAIEELKAFNEQALFLPLRISEHFQSLKVLMLVECGLVSINKKALTGLKLRSLILSYNKVSEISAGIFDDLGVLTLLDVSYNKITTLNEKAFSQLKELSVLKLNNNLLSEITAQIFVNQTKLKVLLLQNNQLTVITSNLIVSSVALEFADFSNNKCINTESTKDSKIPLKRLESFFYEKCSKKSQNVPKT